jgi:Ca2+-transporting ATPase
VAYGVIIGATVLGALWLAINWLGMERQQAVTVSFATVVTARLWHVFNMRSQDSGILRNEVVRNRFVWGALALCIGLLLAAIYFPPFASVLSVVDPGVQGWLLILGMSLIPLVVGQGLKAWQVGRL